MKYIYPAVITKDENAYAITFPDLEGAFTFGYTNEEIYLNAKDCLSLVLLDLEDNKKNIPTSSTIEDIINNYPQAIYMFVEVDTEAYKRQLDNIAVRKNVSIPKWLDRYAKDNNISLSNLLQEALLSRVNNAAQ